MPDLHPDWYRRLLVFWLFTGPVVLVMSNFHSRNWFSLLPGPPPVDDGAYPTIGWVVALLLVWHPVTLMPVAIWSAVRRRSKRDDAAE
jgi:hypothetical protein